MVNSKIDKKKLLIARIKFFAPIVLFVALAVPALIHYVPAIEKGLSSYSGSGSDGAGYRSWGLVVLGILCVGLFVERYVNWFIVKGVKSAALQETLEAEATDLPEALLKAEEERYAKKGVSNA